MGWSLVMGREVNDDIDLEHMSWVCQGVEGEDKMKRSHKEALLNNCVCKLILYETRDGHRTHEMILLWRPNCRVFLLALWVSFRSLLVQKRWTISGPGVEKQQFTTTTTTTIIIIIIVIIINILMPTTCPSKCQFQQFIRETNFFSSPRNDRHGWSRDLESSPGSMGSEPGMDTGPP